MLGKSFRIACSQDWGLKNQEHLKKLRKGKKETIKALDVAEDSFDIKSST
jgi:hypothetical protein